MSNLKDAHFLSVVVDLVQDAVLPDSDSPTFVELSPEPPCSWGARAGSQREDCPVQSLDNRLGEGFKLLGSIRTDK
jgi:hypothetical protein